MQFLCSPLVIIILTIAADQLSKWYMLYGLHLPIIKQIELLPFFNLTMVWNYGVSFGLFSSRDPMNAYFLIGMALIITGWLCVWMLRTQTGFLRVAQALIIGGALGNVIDRVRYGAVADFFDVHVAGYHWPAFNIADSAIFIGVMILLYESLLTQKKSVGSEGVGLERE